MFCCVEMGRQRGPSENTFLFYCGHKALEGSGSQPICCDPLGDPIPDPVYQIFMLIHKNYSYEVIMK